MRKSFFRPVSGDSRSNYLASLKEILYANTKRFRNIIARLERAGEDYTAEDVLKCYLTPSEGKGFISFLPVRLSGRWDRLGNLVLQNATRLSPEVSSVFVAKMMCFSMKLIPI